jgi:hypothetical protein
MRRPWTPNACPWLLETEGSPAPSSSWIRLRPGPSPRTSGRPRRRSPSYATWQAAGKATFLRRCWRVRCSASPRVPTGPCDARRWKPSCDGAASANGTRSQSSSPLQHRSSERTRPRERRWTPDQPQRTSGGVVQPGARAPRARTRPLSCPSIRRAEVATAPTFCVGVSGCANTCSRSSSTCTPTGTRPG